MLDERVEPKLLGAHDVDLGRDRRHHAIGEEDAAECAHQRRADQAAENFRRLVERAHGVDDAEHRRHDAERGQAVGHRLIGVHRLVLLVREGFDLFVHQGFDFMRLRIADDDEAAIVADERNEIRVSQQFRKSLEYFRFLRIVEVALDLAARLGAQFAHQGVQHREQVEEVARLGHLVGDRFDKGLAAVLDGREGIGDNEDAQRRAANDHELERLHEHLEMPAQRRVAADDAAASDDDPDRKIH